MHTLIIAEAGINHGGDINKALEMVDVAEWAGADIVKFQTFRCFPALKKYELSREQHELLIEKCKTIGIEFLSSAFDLESVELLHSLGLKRWKIPSGQITDLPYLRKIASYKEKVLLSMGAAYEFEIERVILELFGCDITLMKCTSEYPAIFSPLRHIVNMGYSDHTKGIAFPIAAVALGATVIEKHFDIAPAGIDSSVSLDPDDLKEMCKQIRFIEMCLLTPVGPSLQEMENRAQFRKSIVAAGPIARGETFTVDNLTTARPGTGKSPMMWDTLIGVAAPLDYEAGQQI